MNHKQIIGTLICLFLLLENCNNVSAQDNYQQRIESLLNKTSLKEKIQQLSGMGLSNNEFGDRDVHAFGTKGVPKIGIPDLITRHGTAGR